MEHALESASFDVEKNMAFLQNILFLATSNFIKSSWPLKNQAAVKEKGIRILKNGAHGDQNESRVPDFSTRYSSFFRYS